VLVAMCLDWLQMRGEITHMAWSRGHLVHPSSSTGFHNTLLLDMNADALTVDLDLGRHTRSINCIVQHTLLPPYHFPYEEIQGKHASRFELSVPRLPFYSRATFVAGGAHRNTLYVVHIIRLGEAMDISLNGAFPNRDPFLETRRLQYLEDHVEWYLPNISGQATLSLRIRPVSFAPLVPGGSDASLAEVPQVVDSCRCGNITAGFGNACDLQVEIPGHRLCVFVAEATRELGHLHHLSGVAGTSSELNAWLLNTTVSGKRVGLNIPEEPPVRYFQPLNNSRMQVVESTFKLTLAAEGLSRQGSQILVSITEDATDSEVTSIPVMFLFLAPPVVLTVDQDSQGDSCFLLPAFHATAEFRTEYMLCGGLSDVDQIATTVSDTRFQVVRQHESSRPGCGEYMDHRLELRVVRKPETNCSGWCKSYQARTEDYDLAVVKSAGHCLRQAMELDDSESMERIIKQQGAALPCVAELGLLGEAVSRNQSAVVKMMLGDKVSWNQTSGGGTPLQIAGMNGNIAMLRLLLEANADLNDQSHGPTALAYASEQCQVPAVRFLLDNGARADVGPRTEDTSEEECKHNPLLYLLMDRAAHCGIEAKQETAKLLLDKNVTK
ncbi:ANKRD52, partial [Symbiodinium microadriaticum]